MPGSENLTDSLFWLLGHYLNLEISTHLLSGHVINIGYILKGLGTTRELLTNDPHVWLILWSPKADVNSSCPAWSSLHVWKETSREIVLKKSSLACTLLGVYAMI